jgi:hypothetical protein
MKRWLGVLLTFVYIGLATLAFTFVFLSDRKW